MEFPTFFVTSGIDGTQLECRFRNLITGISPRHSDTVDVQFLVDGAPVTVALSLAAFAEHARRAGEALTDPEVMHVAAVALREVLEKEGVGEDRIVVPSRQETLEIAAQVHSRALA